MALQPQAGSLVPEWVYVDDFPEADETQLVTSARAWSTQSEAAAGQAGDARHAMDALANTYSGPSAETAQAHVLTARQWMTSVADHCTEISTQVEQAAKYILFTKTSMNVVLLSLQVATQTTLTSSTGLADKIVALVKIRQLQIAAQTMITSLGDACAARIRGLTVPVDINPTLHPPSTAAKTAYGVTTGNVQDVAQSQTGGASAVPAGLTNPATAPDASSDPAGPAVIDDPLAFMNGGPSAAGPGDPAPESPTDPGGAPGADDDARTDLMSGDGQSAADETAQNALDTETSDYGADDLTGDAGHVDPDAAADTLTRPPTGGSQNGGAIDPNVVPIEPDRPSQGDDRGDPGPEASDEVPIVDSDAADQSSHDSTLPSPSGSSGSSGSSGGPPTSSSQPSSQPPSPPPSPPSYQGVGHQPTTSVPDTGSGSGSPGIGAATSHGGSSGDSSGAGSHHESVGTQSAGVSAPAEPAPTQHVGGSAAAQPPAGPAAPAASVGSSFGGTGASSGGVGGPSGSMGPGAPVGPTGPAPLGGPAPVPGPASAGPGLAPAQSTPGGGSVGSTPGPAGPTPGGTSTQGWPPAPAANPPAANAPANPPAAGGAVTGAPTSNAGGPPAANAQGQAGSPSGLQGQQAQAIPPGSRTPVPREDPALLPPLGPDGQPDGTNGSSLLAGGLLGASLGGALIWTDLRQPPPTAATWGAGPHGGTVWATQFGPDDEVTSVLPAGLGLTYQKVLIPGETQSLLELSQPTLRGLIYSLDQVRHLVTPADLHRTLGLGFPITDEHGQSVAVIPADADYVDVIRFNGSGTRT